MSRIGKKPVIIPPGVKIEISGKVLSAEGPKGKLTRNIPVGLGIEAKDDKVFVSRLKARPVEPDILLDGEEGDLKDYGIEAKWIRTPGHTEGSISVVFPGEVAIVGDLVVGRFGVSRKPAYPLWVNDPQQLRDSIRKVLDFSPKVLLSGHGGPFSPEEVKRVFFG